MRRLLTLSAGCLLTLLVGLSCSRDRLSPPEESQTLTTAQIAQDLTKQRAFYDQMLTMAAQIDTTAALDSMAALISRDPDVSWATNVNTGVNVQWRSGLRGFLVLRTRAQQGPADLIPWAGSSPGGEEAAEGPPVGAPARGGPRGSGAAIGGAELAAVPYTVPTHRKTLLLAPCYNEFRVWDQSVIDAGKLRLGGAGYDSFAVYKEDQVTLERLRSIDAGNYGIVRLSSHGAPFPSLTDIQDVYMLTGEVRTPAADSVNIVDLSDGRIGVTEYFGQHLYSINADYFAKYNDFGTSNPLVLLGFCFGYLGGWPSDLRSTSGAGAVVGWDWEVIAGKDAGRTEYLLEAMCDSAQTAPTTLQTWYRRIDPSYQEEDRTITLHYSAPDSFALWQPANFRITEIDPTVGEAGDYVFVYGAGFGSTPGTVNFGPTPASGYGYWFDDRISAQIPEGLVAGPTPVTVTVGHKTSNAISIFIEDELFSVLHGSHVADFYLNAWHMYDPWDSGSRTTFAHLLQPIRWDGHLFFGGAYDGTAERRTRLEVYGSVGTDGRSVSFEYVYADTLFSGGVRTEEFKKARIVNVPFLQLYGGPNYSVYREAVQAHVEELQWSRQVFGGGGEVTESGVYLRTDWEAFPADDVLGVRFR